MPEIDEMSWWQAAEAVDEVFLRGRAAWGGQLTFGPDSDTGKVPPTVRIAPVWNLITLALLEAARSANDEGDFIDVDQVALTMLGGLLTPESTRSLINDRPLSEHIYPASSTLPTPPSTRPTATPRAWPPTTRLANTTPTSATLCSNWPPCTDTAIRNCCAD